MFFTLYLKDLVFLVLRESKGWPICEKYHVQKVNQQIVNHQKAAQKKLTKRKISDESSLSMDNINYFTDQKLLENELVLDKEYPITFFSHFNLQIFRTTISSDFFSNIKNHYRACPLLCFTFINNNGTVYFCFCCQSHCGIIELSNDIDKNLQILDFNEYLSNKHSNNYVLLPLAENDVTLFQTHFNIDCSEFYFRGETIDFEQNHCDRLELNNLFNFKSNSNNEQIGEMKTIEDFLFITKDTIMDYFHNRLKCPSDNFIDVLFKFPYIGSMTNHAFDEFILIRAIGEGATATTFLTVHKETGFHFILKRFNQKAQKQYLSELSQYKSINHQSFALCYGYIKRNRMKGINSCLILQYYPNKSLESIIGKEFDVTQKIIIVLQILFGIDYLHSIGKTHRDIKPENILLDSDLNAYLCDLSSCCEVSKISPDDNVGSFGYLSPEQLEGFKYSFQVDLFAFGYIIYELFSGKRIPQIYSAVGLIDAVLNQKFPKLNIKIPLIDELYKKFMIYIPEFRSDTFISIQRIKEILDSSDKLQINTFSLETVQSIFNNLYLNHVRENSNNENTKNAFSQKDEGLNFLVEERFSEGFSSVIRHFLPQARNNEEKAQFIQMAAESSYSEISKNISESMKYLEEQVNKEGDKKNIITSITYLGNEKLPEDHAKKIAFLEQKVQEGDQIAPVFLQLEMINQGTKFDSPIPIIQMIQGIQMITENKFDEASKVFSDPKIAQDANSLFYKGYTKYRPNRNGERFVKEAISLFTEAAEKGNVDAMHLLGEIYLTGDGIETDEKKGVEFLEKAAKFGSMAAIGRLGSCYLEGVVYEKNLKKAFEMLSQAVKADDPLSYGNLGDYYYYETNEIDKAMKCYEQGAKYYPEESYLLAKKILLERKFKYDPQKAKLLLENAIQRGGSTIINDSKNMLAMMYMNREIDCNKKDNSFPDYYIDLFHNNNDRKAFQLFEEVEISKYADYNQTFRIKGLEELQAKKYKTAAFYFESSAKDFKDPVANFYIGLLFDEKIIPSDPEISSGNYYYDGMNAGSPRSGVCLVRNNYQLLKKNKKLAKEIYTKMHIYGYNYASYKLSKLLLKRNKNKMDIEKGVEYLKIASRRGSRVAMYKMAEYYFKGSFGFKSDTRKSLKWLKKSAQKGFNQAIENIGIWYIEGLHVKRNLMKAKKYFNMLPSCRNVEQYYYEIIDFEGTNEEKIDFLIQMIEKDNFSLISRLLLFQSSDELHEKIMTCIEKARLRHPKNNLILSALVISKILTGKINWDEITFLTSQLTSEEHLYEASGLIGKKLVECKMYDRALPFLEAAIHLDNFDDKVVFSLGFLYTKLGFTENKAENINETSPNEAYQNENVEKAKQLYLEKLSNKKMAELIVDLWDLFKCSSKPLSYSSIKITMHYNILIENSLAIDWESDHQEEFEQLFELTEDEADEVEKLFLANISSEQ
ncbi:hypothetical protein TRFO_42457 [Tritrichomonas foetus]|uniref:Protein kinase domain-containing protein n=1 Tax=Tritrichomonas foetus TaxID=1144522 RepID=A0A1J4KWJ1_9EUKA|nr:hypothetical protein TRFO_42457 [Tritrichomonas foetus]|eukprot:OHT15599.1 hypothetical protein TRFO_42457 [Tritrichomonas foetus]